MPINRFIPFFGILLVLQVSYAGNSRVRERININREWKFIPDDVKGAEAPGLNVARWQDVSLPHSFSVPYFMGSQVYNGYGWYRKTVNIPAHWMDREVSLEFEGAFIETEVFVNGKPVGKHVGGYTGFEFAIRPYLNVGKNIVAVRVNNVWKPDVAPRAGDHQFSGGVYRDVYLNVTSPLRVGWKGTFITTPQVSNELASCSIRTELKNSYTDPQQANLSTELYSPAGKRVGVVETSVLIDGNGMKTIHQYIPRISNPQLWSPQSPSLYTAVTIVKIGKKVVDRYSTRFGIRSFKWTPDRGFFLNGAHVYLIGANVHQDQAGWGDAVTNAAMRRDVRQMKEAGFNCIRGSHYPHDPAFVEACDELGMIFFSENAFWGMGGGSGDRGGWGPPSSSCYPVDPAHHSAFDASVLNQLKAMIRIHRNSASVAAWSLSNEPFFTDNHTDQAMKNLLSRCIDSARSWDPSREVAVGGAQRKRVDRLGKNAIAFYNGDGASRDEFQNPGFPNLVSEYGSTSSYRPGKFFAGWGDILRAPAGSNNPWNPPAWRSGHIIWCGFDHGTIGGVGLATMGIVDYFRLPKRQFYWYKEALTTNNPHPAEPEWPQRGVAAKLQLSTSNSVISATNGTDDAHLIVSIVDASGRPLSNELPVTLTVISGPGEFPTGRSIRFSPPSGDEASDIILREGKAAIAFRSYHAGQTRIEASAAGLEPAYIELTTKGTPRWNPKLPQAVADRPYKRYVVPVKSKMLDGHELLLAANRPSWVSSTRLGTNKANVNDSDVATVWMPESNDNQKWWKLALEASYCVSQIEIEFPDKANYQYRIEVSKDDVEWQLIADESRSTSTEKVRLSKGDFGCGIAFIRIQFLSDRAALAEVRVGGVPSE